MSRFVHFLFTNGMFERIHSVKVQTQKREQHIGNQIYACRVKVIMPKSRYRTSENTCLHIMNQKIGWTLQS